MKHILRTICIILVINGSLACSQKKEQALSTVVGEWNGKPAFFINGQPMLPQIYALASWPSGRCSYYGPAAHNIGEFAKLGFKLYQMDLWFEDMLPENGPLDISEAQRRIAGVLEQCPDAAVMFRLHTNPPFWWLKANPDECVRYADTDVIPEPYRPSHQSYEWQDLNPVPRCSYASTKWQEWMEGLVAQFCRELSATPEGKRVFGIMLANGVNGENHNWAFVRHDPDCSEPMLEFYHKFLKEKYGSDEALRLAWENPEATAEGALMPDMSQRHTADGRKSQATADYYEALQRAITGSILSFADIVHKNWPVPITVGCFYGYYFSLFGRQTEGGHLCEEDIFGSPDIDFICAPQTYNRRCRLPGGPALSRGLVESALAHGKVWMDEMDQPSTYGHIYLGALYEYKKPQSLWMLRKFVLSPFLRGAGMWYYDFGPTMASGWWDDPDHLAEIARMREIEEEYFAKEQSNVADVLLVYDTKVYLHQDSDESEDLIAIESFKSGAAVATCYLSDLGLMPLSDYKAVVLANISKAEAETVSDLCTFNGTTVEVASLKQLPDAAGWRNIFTKAGCHIYASDGDAVSAGNGLIMIHTENGGAREVTLRSGKKIRFELQPLETVLLDAESGDMLLPQEE